MDETRQSPEQILKQIEKEEQTLNLWINYKLT